MSAVAGAGFPFWILRMTLLRYMFLQILWAYSSQAEEPCTVDVTEMQSRGIELSEKSKGKQYIPHGDFVEFKCKVGYAHPAVWSASDCTVRCYSSNVSYPQSYKEICPVLDLENGRIYYSYWRKFREGATTSYSCKRDYSPENEQDRITCTKNGWSPTPRCIPETTCHADHLENGRFHRNYWRTSYKINERITYSCNSENDRENQQRTVTCTKNGWWPTPRCIPDRTSD